MALTHLGNNLYVEFEGDDLYFKSKDSDLVVKLNSEMIDSLVEFINEHDKHNTYELRYVEK